MTRLVAIATTGLLAAAVAASANPAATAADGSTHYREHDYAGGQAKYVLPPGENGLVNAADAARFKADGTRPANSADQRPQYADLLYGYHDLTDAGLGRYFNDESFGVRPATWCAPRPLAPG